MMERPIIFSGPMVQAILAGRKTQTRRVIKNQPTGHDDFARYAAEWNEAVKSGTSDGLRFNLQTGFGLSARACPYGLPGDTLWVRESWQAWTEFNDTKADDLPAEMRRNINYPANGNSWDARIRPSIHMPRWASRLTLCITDIRVQRVQDISEEDAKAEGAPLRCINSIGAPERGPDSFTYTHRGGFGNVYGAPGLWDSINGKKAGHDWGANPWCWCLTFTVDGHDTATDTTTTATNAGQGLAAAGLGEGAG